MTDLTAVLPQSIDECEAASRRAREVAELAKTISKARKSQARFRSWIYFIQAESGPIKIGLTTDTHKRVGKLQCGNHETLTLLARTPGRASDEKRLHTRFAEHHIRGEWFKPHADILALVAKAKSAHPILSEIMRIKGGQ